MMLHHKTTVLPGNVVRVEDKQLVVGQDVTVTIQPLDAPGPNLPQSMADLLEWIRNRPPSKRTREEWDQFDKEFRAERDAWDRSI